MIGDSRRTRTPLLHHCRCQFVNLIFHNIFLHFASREESLLAAVATPRWREKSPTQKPGCEGTTNLSLFGSLIQDNSSCQSYLPKSFTLGTSKFHCGKLAVWDLNSKSRLVVRCDRRQLTASKLLWNEEEWWQPSHRHLLLILPSKRYYSLHKA